MIQLIEGLLKVSPSPDVAFTQQMSLELDNPRMRWALLAVGCVFVGPLVWCATLPMSVTA